MGKKSKRNRPQKSGKAALPIRGARSAPSSSIVSYTSESAFLPPSFASDVPENGWARELRYAEKDLRHNQTDIGVIMRTAKAARVMRQFDRLSEIMAKAESKKITIEDCDGISLWRQLKDDCKSSGRVTCIPSPKIQDFFAMAMDEDLDLDNTNFGHDTYSNLNSIQFAASMGDIQLLEKIVSLGAALDYACDDIDDSVNRTSKTVRKPVGSTALLLAVIQASIYRRHLALEKVSEESHLRDFYEGQVECAVQLVRLGANVNVKLRLPPGRDAKSKLYEMMKELRWVGKSVRELALETGSELLVQTIELFDRSGDAMNITNCRCGSRLPWKMCHAGKKSDCYYYESGDSERVLWRYSPLAKCPCGNSSKTYFKCCWEDTGFREHYKHDETAEVKSNIRATLNLDGREITVDSFKNIMGRFTPEEALKVQCDAIRSLGLSSYCLHPKSKIHTWDPFVYAGTMEQIDDFFQWSDIHWNMPKRELLKRVDEWNEALRKYCDKEGLVGAERERVIKLHTASPLAPCANSNCDKVETKVKQFTTCSRCNFVGYCSQDCLKEDFQYHRPRCTKIGQ